MKYHGTMVGFKRPDGREIDGYLAAPGDQTGAARRTRSAGVVGPQ